MKQPSIKAIKILFAKSGNLCAFPGCPNPIIEDSGIVTGHICHINAKQSGGPRYNPKLSPTQIHAYENLILLCSRHHQIVDKEIEKYDVDVLLEIKKIHEEYNEHKETNDDQQAAKSLLAEYQNIHIVNNTGNVMLNSPGAIQAHNLKIQSKKSNIHILPPSGTIADDIRLLAYVKHLIKRYNDFASKDTSRRVKFNYGAIYRNIEANFGAKYDLVSKARADELIEYLQRRIDRTKQACYNKGRGNKSYSTYEDYVNKHYPE